MTRYYLRLLALSPLSMTSHQNVTGQASATMSYIPGTTLRGALAWQMLRARPMAGSEAAFQALFTDGGLRCGPLYALAAHDHDEPAAELSLPLPLTARSCKRHGGFCTDPNVVRRQRQHGALDVLIDAIEEEALRRIREDASEGRHVPPLTRDCADTSEVPAQSPKGGTSGLARHEKCGWTGCGASLDRFGGYCQFGDDHGRRWFRSASPRKSLITRTAILDQLETARPAALFSREVLTAGQEFAGFLEAPDGLADDMRKLLDKGEEIQVGAGRTAGLGRLQVADFRKDDGVATRMIGSHAARQAAFTERLSQVLADRREALRDRWALTPITFTSDAILLDRWLRYATAAEPDVLRDYAELETPPAESAPPPGLELFLSVARPVRCAAWHTGAADEQGRAISGRGGRPRTTDLGIAAGSVFVLAAPPDQADALLAYAAWLEKHGLGERREEGYGQLVAAHPFHKEVEAV
jgi:CRISPR-associated protein Csx10